MWRKPERVAADTMVVLQFAWAAVTEKAWVQQAGKVAEVRLERKHTADNKTTDTKARMTVDKGWGIERLVREPAADSMKIGMKAHMPVDRDLGIERLAGEPVADSRTTGIKAHRYADMG